MNKIRVAAFFCIVIFAVGVCAAQTPGAQPNSGQMGTPSMQQPQTTTPAQGAPATPSAQSAPQSSQGRMSNVDEQVKVLSDQLNLSQDQQSKLKQILTDQHEQAMALIQDNSMDREAKMDKIHSLRSNTIAKVRDMLTAEQKPKFDAMVQQQDERIHERQQQDQGGNPAAPSGAAPGSSPSSTSSGSTPPSTTSPNANPPASAPPTSNPPAGAKPPQ